MVEMYHSVTISAFNSQQESQHMGLSGAVRVSPMLHVSRRGQQGTRMCVRLSECGIQQARHGDNTEPQQKAPGN